MLDAGSMPHNVAGIATSASPFVAKRQTDVAILARYEYGMLSEWLAGALDHGKISGAELARQLTARLGRSIDRAAVNKMLKGTRKIAGDELLEIQKITDFAAPGDEEENVGTVPLMGYVGAGALFVPFETGTPIDRVPAPEGATEDTAAVEIRGDSLGMLFDRWLVYYDEVRNPPSREMLNKLCVVGLADGRIMVKKLAKGQIPGLFNLLSNIDAPIYDVVVEWCAVVKNMSPR